MKTETWHPRPDFITGWLLGLTREQQIELLLWLGDRANREAFTTYDEVNHLLKVANGE